jgi:hypothetical protein
MMITSAVSCVTRPPAARTPVTARDLGEHLGSRAGPHGKVALDGGPEAVEILLEDLRLLAVGKDPQPESSPHAAPLQRDFSDSFGVADPLGAPPWGDEETAAAEMEHVDRRRVHPASLPAPHLQQEVVTQSEPEAHEQAEDLVEDPVERARFAELGHGTHSIQ